MEIELTAAFRAAYPEGIFGALVVRECPNRPQAIALADDQRVVEEGLRARFTEETIETHPVALAYAGHYRRYGARYPVVHQAKTILAGGSIGSPSALVAAMFVAEVHNLVLTSGHDLDVLRGPLRVGIATDGEVYTRLSGKEQRLKPGDMVVRDQDGVIASVVYGPDYRTRLRPQSSAALFGAWCPAGIPYETVREHLVTLGKLVQREWPAAVIGLPLIHSVAPVQ